jgi:hemolysin III
VTALRAKRELIADGVVHGLGIALGLAGAVSVVALAATNGGAGNLAPTLIYAAGLLAMLGCSAAYNVFHASPRRDWLRRFDHAAIFVMIAGSYTPFTTLGLNGAWSAVLTAVIWSVAAAGVVLKLWQPRCIETISVGLYLALGWIGLVAAGPFLSALDPLTLGLLAVGGVLYSVGVVFHLWRRLPYHNAIWHGFVLVAACVHYAAVVGVVAA